MLAIKDILLVQHVAAVLRGTKEAEPAEITTLANDLDAIATAGLQARSAMAEAAKSRPKQGKQGRPPVNFYEVAMEPLWSVVVGGAGEAYAAVMSKLSEYGLERQAPAQTSISVQLSRQGGWHTHMVTDIGEYDLTVRKVRNPNAEPEPATPAAPKKPRGETGRERLARLAKEGIT